MEAQQCKVEMRGDGCVLDAGCGMRDGGRGGVWVGGTILSRSETSSASAVGRDGTERWHG